MVASGSYNNYRKHLWQHTISGGCNSCNGCPEQSGDGVTSMDKVSL